MYYTWISYNCLNFAEYYDIDVKYSIQLQSW